MEIGVEFETSAKLWGVFPRALMPPKPIFDYGGQGCHLISDSKNLGASNKFILVPDFLQLFPILKLYN